LDCFEKKKELDIFANKIWTYLQKVKNKIGKKNVIWKKRKVKQLKMTKRTNYPK